MDDHQHIPAVPEWLVSFVLGTVIPWVMSTVIKYMKVEFHKPSNGYVGAMSQNADFYRSIQYRVDDALAARMKTGYENDF